MVCFGVHPLSIMVALPPGFCAVPPAGLVRSSLGAVGRTGRAGATGGGLPAFHLLTASFTADEIALGNLVLIHLSKNMPTCALSNPSMMAAPMLPPALRNLSISSEKSIFVLDLICASRRLYCAISLLTC